MQLFMKLLKLNILHTINQFKIHNKLNPQLWNKNTLKEDVFNSIMSYVDMFITDKKITTKIEDIILIGSSCDVNYNKNSDIDVHLIVDLDEESDEYSNIIALCKLWNLNNSIKIHNHTVEVNPQNKNNKDISMNAAMYSLKNKKWIREPTYNFKITQNMKEEIANKCDDYITKAQSYYKKKDGDSLKELLSTIKDERKEGVRVHGEMAISNLVFKTLRNHGCITEWEDRVTKFRIIEPLTI